jgi:hypothetical protein
MLHPDILTISYRHRYEIKNSLKDVLGLLGIAHFSLDLIRPDGQLLYFSGTPSHGYELCSRGYGAFDATVSPHYYKNNEFYWWHDVTQGKFSQEINYYRQERFGFTYGFMMVRYWDDFYMIYSFATRVKSPQFVDDVNDNLDTLFEAGDYLYNSMRELYSEYTENFTPPIIDKFYPYQGGRPVARMSRYRKSSHGILLPHDRWIDKKPVNLTLVVDNSD